MPTYQQKLKPISTTTPSYQAKLKPIARPSAPQKPKLRDIATNIPKVFNTPISPSFPAKEGGADTIIGNIGRSFGNITSSAAEDIRLLGQPFANIPSTLKGTYKDLKPLGIKGAMSALGAGVKETTQNIAKAVNTGVNAAGSAVSSSPVSTASTASKYFIEHPTLVPSLLMGGGAIGGKDLVRPLANTVTRGADTSLSNITSKVASSIPTSNIISRAQQKRIAEFQKILNPSKGLTASEARYNKNSPEFAAQLEREGVKLDFGRDSRGRLDTTVAQENVSAIAQRDNQAMDRLLESSGAWTNLDDITDTWKAAVRQDYKGTEQATALQHVDDEMAAYKQQYANISSTDKNGRTIIPAKQANEIKQDLWSKSKFPQFGTPTDQLNAGTKYLGGHAFKEAIQSVDPAVQELNQRLGDIAALQKMLQKANGGAVHGGFASRMTARIIGGIAGSGGGITGTVTGAITADLIANALTNPGLSTSRIILSRAANEVPDILKKVEQQIGKNAQEILSRKALPAPTQINIHPGYTPGPNYNLPRENRGLPPTITGGETTPSVLPSSRSGLKQTLPPQSQSPKNVSSSQNLPRQGNSSNSVLGVAAGFQSDEEGNLNFDPVSAALGVGFAGLASRASSRGKAVANNAKPKTVALKGAQSYAKEASSFIKQNPNSRTLKLIDAFHSWYDDGVLPKGFSSGNTFLTEFQKYLKREHAVDLTGATADRTAKFTTAVENALAKLDAKYEKVEINNPFDADIGGAKSTGTPSSKPSTVGDMSISKKPNGKEGGLGRTTSTSGPFDGNGPTLAFRGGNKTSTDSIKGGRYYAPPGEPIWFSPRKEIASNYGDSLLEADLSSLRFLEDGSPEFSRLNPTNISIKKQEFHDLLTKAGYDGLKMGNGDFAVFNPAAIKRISSPSLPKELEGLAAEARKFDTPQDFGKALQDVAYALKHNEAILNSELADAVKQLEKYQKAGGADFKLTDFFNKVKGIK